VYRIYSRNAQGEHVKKDVLLERRRRPSTRIRNLLNLGTVRLHAIMTGLGSKGYWHLSRTLATQSGMINKWLKEQGLISVKDIWLKVQGYA